MDPTAWPTSGLNHSPVHSLGASITPSSEMKSPDTTFLMAISLVLLRRAADCDTAAAP
jgi:hypothetical protein